MKEVCFLVPSLPPFLLCFYGNLYLVLCYRALSSFHGHLRYESTPCLMESNVYSKAIHEVRIDKVNETNVTTNIVLSSSRYICDYIRNTVLQMRRGRRWYTFKHLWLPIGVCVCARHGGIKCRGLLK